MAYRMFDFECTGCANRFEKLVDTQCSQVQCDSCEALAIKAVSAPTFKLDGCSGDYPTAYDAWERVRKEKRQQEIKQTT